MAYGVRPAQSPPAWFTARSHDWAVVYLPQEQLLALLRAWDNPATRPHLTKLSKGLRTARLIAEEIVKQTDWSTVDSWLLVTMLEGMMVVKCGAFLCVPDEFRSLPEGIRWRLYTQALAVKALKKPPATRHGNPLFSLPLFSVIRAELFRLAGKPAGEEMVRRSRAQVGYHAAKLAILMDANTDASQEDVLDAMEALRKSVWRKVPKGQCRDAEDFKDLRQDVNETIMQTVHRRWGKKETFELLAQSLEGNLNITPRAIRDAFTKKLYRQKSLSRTEEKDWEIQIRLSKWGPEEYRYDNEIREWTSKHPKFRRLIEMDEAQTQKEKAEDLGITDRTWRNWSIELKNFVVSGEIVRKRK